MNRTQWKGHTDLELQTTQVLPMNDRRKTIWVHDLSWARVPWYCSKFLVYSNRFSRDPRPPFLHAFITLLFLSRMPLSRSLRVCPEMQHDIICIPGTPPKRLSIFLFPSLLRITLLLLGSWLSRLFAVAFCFVTVSFTLLVLVNRCRLIRECFFGPHWCWCRNLWMMIARTLEDIRVPAPIGNCSSAIVVMQDEVSWLAQIMVLESSIGIIGYLSFRGFIGWMYEPLKCISRRFWIANIF